MTGRALHVAYFAEHYLPESGALPARVSEMAREWVCAGAEVTVVCAMPHRPEGRIREGYRGRLFSDTVEDGIRVMRSWVYASPSHSFAATIFNNLSHAAFSAHQVFWSNLRPDVIIASEPPFMPHIVGKLFGSWWRVPVVLEIRDLWPDYLAEMGIVPRVVVQGLLGLEGWMLRRAAHVVTVTESFRTRVIAKGVQPARATTISNGVNPFFYRPISKPRVHAALTRRRGEKVVGYLGNFGRGQGLEQVVEAARILRDRRENVRFVLFGDGPTRADIARRVREVDGDTIEVHPPIPKEDTPDFYNSCDVVLVPHAPLKVLAETVPSKLFEVMACGRSLVASVAGEAARVVEETGGGLVARPGDAKDLAGKVCLAFGAIPSEGAREHVVGAYSRSALARRYMELLIATSERQQRRGRRA